MGFAREPLDHLREIFREPLNHLREIFREPLNYPREIFREPLNHPNEKFFAQVFMWFAVANYFVACNCERFETSRNAKGTKSLALREG